MACDEDESIQLHDKMNWIFYNTTADLSEAPEGIKKFLSYVENEHAEDEFTRLLDKEVKNARLNEEWRSEYLKTYVNDMDMKREGYLEGEEHGKAEGERERDRFLVNRWKQKGKEISEIADDLGKSEEYVRSLLCQFLDIIRLYQQVFGIKKAGYLFLYITPDRYTTKNQII